MTSKFKKKFKTLLDPRDVALEESLQPTVWLGTDKPNHTTPVYM